MKIRNGFVSNSSTSSFIVMARSGFGEHEGEVLLSEKQIELLIKKGFKPGNSPNCMDVETQNDEQLRCVDEEPLVYYRYVICNQDNVIEHLVKNRIPFKGLVHYGTSSIFYDGNNEGEVLEIRNSGFTAESSLSSNPSLDCLDDKEKEMITKRIVKS